MHFSPNHHKRVEGHSGAPRPEGGYGEGGGGRGDVRQSSAHACSMLEELCTDRQVLAAPLQTLHLVHRPDFLSTIPLQLAEALRSGPIFGEGTLGGLYIPRGFPPMWGGEGAKQVPSQDHASGVAGWVSRHPAHQPGCL